MYANLTGRELRALAATVHRGYLRARNASDRAGSQRAADRLNAAARELDGLLSGICDEAATR